MNKCKQRAKHSSYHSWMLNVNTNSFGAPVSKSVAPRLTSSPRPGARAWPRHGSGVGAWWRSPYRLFLGARGWVEVFCGAVRPGLTLFAFGPGSGWWGGVGNRAAMCAWFMVCPVVVTGRSFVPGEINVINAQRIYYYYCNFVMYPLVIFMASAPSMPAVGPRAVKETTSLYQVGQSSELCLSYFF